MIMLHTSSEPVIIVQGNSETDVGRIISASPSHSDLDDLMDIQTATETEALYSEHGRAAFIPLSTYRERKRDK